MHTQLYLLYLVTVWCYLGKPDKNNTVFIIPKLVHDCLCKQSDPIDEEIKSEIPSPQSGIKCGQKII